MTDDLKIKRDGVISDYETVPFKPGSPNATLKKKKKRKKYKSTRGTSG